MIGQRQSYAPFTLASVQLQRNTLWELMEAKTPWREASLEGFRRRNAILDAFFYDIGNITNAEAIRIAPWLAKEGALLIVPPSGTEPLTLCSGIDHFAQNGGTDIRVLAVAGVGSSALGSAAFARNIADAFDEPVAALVSGYGLADLITEAAGGWFWFGALNNLRHQFETIDDVFRGTREDSDTISTNDTALNPVRTSLDTRTLYKLLSDKRFHFSLVTGHSKGNLVVSEALYAHEANKSNKSMEEMSIVTVSATVAMPSIYKKNIVDVMGQIDWLGKMNSRLQLGVEVAPQAWHHTNTELWWHLPVTKVFKELKEQHRISMKFH